MSAQGAGTMIMRMASHVMTTTQYFVDAVIDAFSDSTILRIKLTVAVPVFIFE